MSCAEQLPVGDWFQGNRGWEEARRLARSVRLGGRLTPLKARIFDAIRRCPDGDNLREIALPDREVTQGLRLTFRGSTTRSTTRVTEVVATGASDSNERVKPSFAAIRRQGARRRNPAQPPRDVAAIGEMENG